MLRVAGIYKGWWLHGLLWVNVSWIRIYLFFYLCILFPMAHQCSHYEMSYVMLQCFTNPDIIYLLASIYTTKAGSSHTSSFLSEWSAGWRLKEELASSQSDEAFYLESQKEVLLSRITSWSSFLALDIFLAISAVKTNKKKKLNKQIPTLNSEVIQK